MITERGSILITALIFMMVMTFMLIAFLDMSTVGIKQTVVSEEAKKAFYLADGGLSTVAKVVERVFSEKSIPAAEVFPQVTFNDNGAGADNDGDGYGLMEELLGFTNSNDDPINTPDITINVGDDKVFVALRKIGSTGFTGATSGEFASGYEGIGAGAASGGTYNYIEVDAVGKTGFGAKSNILGIYRKVAGVSGGTK